MKKFKKSPDADEVFLPMVGRVTKDLVLEGDEFERFVPKYLTEVPSIPEVALEATPLPAPVLTEPAPMRAPSEPSRQEQYQPLLTETMPEEPEKLLIDTFPPPEEAKKSRGRPKKT